VLKVHYNTPQPAIIRQIRAFIKTSPEMDAILFATNYLGVAGLEGIDRLGIRIPEQLAVVCFDDHDVFRLYPPGISAFEQPIARIAKTAISILIKQLNAKTDKPKARQQQIILDGKFIKRRST
jgi:LacI family transcriptional regulator